MVHSNRRTPKFAAGSCPRLLLAAGILTGGLAMQSCSDGLRDIDAEVDAMVRRGSETIGGGSVSPSRSWAETGSLLSPDNPNIGAGTDIDSSARDIASMTPGTRNPPAGALVFKERDKPLTVDERLEELRKRQVEGYGEKIELNLEDLWRQAIRTAPEYLASEEDYILSSISLLIERHQWSPRLSGSMGAEFEQSQDDGKVASTLGIINSLGVRQRLLNGGEAQARWVWNATENLRSNVTGQYRQASSLILDASIPLLRGAGQVARETLIQSERNLIYAAREFEAFRREYLAQLARDYFDLLRQQQAIENTRVQLRSIELLVTENEKLYEAGRTALFQVDLARNQLLSARSNLVNQEESLLLALDRFKVRLGLPGLATLSLSEFSLSVPEPEVSLDEATQAALAFRLDLQNRRDQLDDSLRDVYIARNNLLPDLTLAGNASLPTDSDAREGGVVYELDDSTYGAAITLDLPLDRRIERLQLRSAVIAYNRTVRDYNQFRDDLVLDVRARVREIERAKVNLMLAEQQVEITQRREREQQLRKDEVTTRDRLDTQQELLDARNTRDQAEADLRNSVLDYLVATAQLRVKTDGTFETLPGMTTTQPAPEPTGEPAAPGAQPARPTP